MALFKGDINRGPATCCLFDLVEKCERDQKIRGAGSYTAGVYTGIVRSRIERRFEEHMSSKMSAVFRNRHRLGIWTPDAFA